MGVVRAWANRQTFDWTPGDNREDREAERAQLVGGAEARMLGSGVLGRPCAPPEVPSLRHSGHRALSSLAQAWCRCLPSHDGRAACNATVAASPPAATPQESLLIEHAEDALRCQLCGR